MSGYQEKLLTNRQTNKQTDRQTDTAFWIKVGIRQCQPHCRPTYALGLQNFANPVFKKTSVCEGRFFTHERDSVILPLVHRFYDTKESFSLLQLPF